MPQILLIVSIPAGLLAVYLFYKLYKKSRRQKILKLPFPEKWEKILKEIFPIYNLLPAAKQKGLKDLIKIFIHEKNFEGAGGLEITDEIKVSVASQACFLILNKNFDVYPTLQSIVIYPSTYKHQGQDIPGMIVKDSIQVAGESWDRGLVVLAWDQVSKGVANLHDGHNVVFHEFAHQLDSLDGSTDGVPLLDGKASYQAWSNILSKDFLKLVAKKKKHQKSLMDKYGATNPQEFFAVATETFFEKPAALKKKHPELYRQLQDFYEINPIKELEDL
ncbi:MAG: zinc-dependent peptidase [Deltaproteobacteria bacterium]|jgi:Mlc titration factor MtfA (ptsG expression regulator)|nr:zinc-dependent peptidase [Deltaproteobacteria bacterium]